MWRSMARLSDLKKKNRESSEVTYLRPTLSESSTRSQSRLKGTRLRKQGKGGEGGEPIQSYVEIHSGKIKKKKKIHFFFLVCIIYKSQAPLAQMSQKYLHVKMN